MLATAGALPAGPGWAYELKWDGVRALAVCDGGAPRLYARRGNEITGAYPELAGLGAGLPAGTVLDGEIVVLDADGRPSFAALAERMHVRGAARAGALAAATPVTYLIFDLLRLDGVDLVGVGYGQRREFLDELAVPLAPAGARWMVPPSFDDGSATLAACVEHGLEGVVAKRLTAPYRPGTRSPDWVKVKNEQTADYVVGGWRPGARAIGALLVGVPGPEPQSGGGLVYRGRVGGGISAAAERELLATLRPLVIPASPFGASIPLQDAATAIWVRPELVVEVKFGERTRDDRLRFPRFVRLRPDKAPQECHE